VERRPRRRARTNSSLRATGLPSSYTGTTTAGSGYALLEKNPTGSPAANESELATSTGTYTGTFTLSASANWSALVATFAAPAGPTVTTASLPNGAQNVAYTATLAATGGTLPYTWSITSGSLPTGLTPHSEHRGDLWHA
jgi:hypothetical protein